MADGNIFRFPTTLRSVPSFTSDDTAPVADRVEITAGLTKVYAVRIDGWIYAEFDVCSLAIRCRGHLLGLEALGTLPGAASPEPTNPEAA